MLMIVEDLHNKSRLRDHQVCKPDDYEAESGKYPDTQNLIKV
jgi:hypothetical protein